MPQRPGHPAPTLPRGLARLPEVALVLVLQARDDVRRVRPLLRLDAAQALLRRALARALQPLRELVGLPREDRVRAPARPRRALVVVGRDLLPRPLLPLVRRRLEGLRLVAQRACVLARQSHRREPGTRAGTRLRIP